MTQQDEKQFVANFHFTNFYRGDKVRITLSDNTISSLGTSKSFLGEHEVYKENPGIVIEGELEAVESTYIELKDGRRIQSERHYLPSPEISTVGILSEIEKI